MPQISRLCEGVYLNESVALGPECIEHEGVALSRFMDIFYIRGVTEDLGPDAVSAICTVRAQRLDSLGPANRRVHQLFRSLVCRRAPNSLLEIGAGINPVLSEGDVQNLLVRYVKCDADASVENDVHKFSESAVSLPCASASFDMAVAVFVLHFRFGSQQIAELYRCLTLTGVFVANVYRRSEESMMRLTRAFEGAGFVIGKLPDPKNLCEGHQYWVCGKDPNTVEEVLAEIALVASEPDPTITF